MPNIVPLGVNIAAWGRATTANTASKSAYSPHLTVISLDGDNHSAFRRVNTKGGIEKKGKKSIKVNTKMVSDVEEELDRVREQNKNPQVPTTTNVSLNMAAVSSKVGKKRKTSNIEPKSKKRKVSQSSRIKSLAAARKAQKQPSRGRGRKQVTKVKGKKK